MNSDITLEHVIRQHINLKPSSRNGWYKVLCKVCNDHGRKGPRAGFKFEGDTVGYSCFNCGHAAGYDPMKHRSTMPRNMAEVLEAFGVERQEWQEVLFNAFMEDNPDSTGQRRAPNPANTINPESHKLPDCFYPLTDDKDDIIAQEAIDFLARRNMDWRDYPYYLAERTDHPFDKRMFGRLIIPIYKDDKVIFWQGRDLLDTQIPKYLSALIPRDKVIYGFDKLFLDTDEPLYVTEGFFDAFRLDGVAIFGNKMTPEQIKWLSKSPRTKVYIPDKFGDGHIAAMQALELGWEVSIPDWGNDVKDVSDSVKRYGDLFTKLAIKRGTRSGFAAEVELRLYCKVEDDQPKKRDKTAGSKTYSKSRA